MSLFDFPGPYLFASILCDVGYGDVSDKGVATDPRLERGLAEDVELLRGPAVLLARRVAAARAWFPQGPHPHVRLRLGLRQEPQERPHDPRLWPGAGGGPGEFISSQKEPKR